MTTRRRALGQHFLRDGAVARAIVDLVGPTSRDLVVEIGPGQGALTGELVRRAGHVVALEIDRVLVAALRARVAGAEIVEADARTWDYGRLERPSGGRVLVVGNLPYSTSKPILAALVAARTRLDAMAVMLQREVAERVAAPPGSKVYGSLSVLTQIYIDVRLALRVGPEAFRPPPKVDSAVLHLTVLPAPRVMLNDDAHFHTLVRAAFARRRKTLANALAAGLGVSAEEARRAVARAGVDPGCRAETLAIRDFAALATAMMGP
jgi:16S rRNA (adenine1518-N6/adenine1519-N6)-dimethyltransferase